MITIRIKKQHEYALTVRTLEEVACPVDSGEPVNVLGDELEHGVSADTRHLIMAHHVDQRIEKHVYLLLGLHI